MAAGGKAKIDQQQNTGNYCNPDHEQQTCGLLFPIGSEADWSLTPPAPTPQTPSATSHEKNTKRVSHENFNSMGKKESLLPHLENVFLVVSHFAETRRIFRVRNLSRALFNLQMGDYCTHLC